MFRVLIRENPFAEILRSAYEGLNVECMGTLFGEKFRNKKNRLYVVEEAHPIQLTNRFPNGTSPLVGSIRSELEFSYKHIGGFHSHPTSRKQKNGYRYKDLGRVYLSKQDRKNLREDWGKIEIVIALREVTQCHRVLGNDYVISGYIRKNKFSDKNYRFDLSAYSWIKGRANRAIIEAPKSILKMLR